MILLNFKLYPETFGDEAINLSAIAKQVMENTGVKIIPVLSALDAVRVKEKLNIDVYLQHVDVYSQGPHTGYVSALAAKSLGIKGALINHSEHRLKLGTLKQILKSWPADFDSILCLQSYHQLLRWALKLRVKYYAYEPKEFIGNPNLSVASARPEQINNFVKTLSPKPILVGAGIHSREDVSTSLKLGASGILVSSSVIKSVDPKKELMALASVFSV
ncbi:MAG TPA: triose-phosphate isomerase [Candidatus Woesebacteria bacterium]|nr:triose-phosphate isomerase [Candidatus Woesebacteria bacterium]